MRTLILIASCLLFNLNLFAQTGIGTTTPNPSAKLDVYSTNKGFLPPRIALLSTTDVATISSPANGLIIYNTATAGTTPNNVLPGYYYWDGSKWNGLVDQGALNSFSGYVPNYAQSNASSVTKSAVGDIIVSQSITTSGRPIQIIASGDANPLAAGGWIQLQLYRDGTAIGKKVQAESSASNENVPYCLNYIDNPTAGTYTYSVKVTVTSGVSFQFGEADGNQITLLELGAWSAGTMPVSKGGTGNSSYTAGSVMFSDGTNIAQNNSKLFWDNTNQRLGIGTNTPTAKLNLVGGGIRIHDGFSNTTNRPTTNTSTVGNYEIRGVGSNGGTTQGDNGDDGFLRLSAGGGTNANTQSSIDLSGYSTVGDMSTNIVMSTGGTERLRIDNSGNVNVKGKINLTDPTGNVATKVAGLFNVDIFVQLDNIKAAATRNGAGGGWGGLSIAAVTSSFYCNIGATYGMNGGSGGSATQNTQITTTPTNSLFGWGFGNAGDLSTYLINDTTSGKVYRITLSIGSGYYNNFVSIERLL